MERYWLDILWITGKHSSEMHIRGNPVGYTTHCTSEEDFNSGFPLNFTTFLLEEMSISLMEKKYYTFKAEEIG